jgi:rhodanese-related sulfurtransferase
MSFSSEFAVDLQRIINDNAFLVDVRTPDEYAEGHVAGSVNIPLDSVPFELEQFKGKDNIVVFCRSGMRSAQAKGFLDQQGFTNVVNAGAWTTVNEMKK